MTSSISGHPLQAAQPIVNNDGTMAYHFRNWAFQVNQAVGESSLLSVWGSISGSIAAQTDLQTALGTAGGAAAWGGITGTLSDQSDLQGELDGKSDTSHTHTEVDITDLDKYTQSEVDALLVYYPPVVRDEATDPYTLVLADANKVLRFTTASAAVTIPVEASVAFPTGTEISIRQAGTGTLVLTTTSLTINGTVPSWAQHIEVKFRKVGADTWDVV